MGELKTQKEIMLGWDNSDGINAIEHYKTKERQEAIKRYKFWDKMCISPPDMDTLVNYMQIWGRMAELKEFFNLTEEELK